ncbi:MAG: FtsX-like permease family protein [Planctomycetota bacterium]
MKFLHYIFANLMRNKLRTLLTIGGITIAMFLFCFLEAVLTGFTSGVDMSDASRLIVRNAVSLVQPLPIAYRERILKVPGVKDIGFACWFGGTYEAKKDEFFGQFAINDEDYLRLYPEFQIPDEQRRAFLGERKACILGKKEAERLQKKVGDTIVLTGTIYFGTWEFIVRGIYQGTKENVDETMMLFHYQYVDDSMPENERGQVGWYVVQIDDPSQAAAVSTRIDDLFRNSAYATRTETERAFQLGFVSMMGNIQLLLRSIGAAVVFTILMVAANTMMMAARERTAEIGILKTLGFPDRTVFFLTMAEAVAIALFAGVLGCLGSKVLFDHVKFNPGGFFPIFYVPWQSAIVGLIIAMVAGLVSGLAPAFQAARMPVALSLRKVV